MSEAKSSIDVPENGPFLVKGSVRYTDADGNEIQTEKEVVALCRCGASKNKPFCDGTHSDIGFSGACERTETYPTREFEGDDLTVIDNIGICCHAGECVDGAPEVFFEWDDDVRISKPDKASREKLMDVIRKCPSGSLVYRLDGEVVKTFFTDPEIFVSKDGPLHVRGGIALNDDDAQPVTDSHYTLCRCGASKNKPFCDGAHKDVGFKG